MAVGFALFAFTMRTMVPLRLAALCSKLCFIVWAALEGLAPVLALHTALLPFNVLRLGQILSLDRRGRAARHSTRTADMLMPFARRLPVRDDQVLFRERDPADFHCCIVSGRVRVEPAGVELGAGDLFGEIAFFSRTRERTQTVRAAQERLRLALGEASLLRLHHENPTFSFRISEMIATRMVDNLRRLQEAARDARGALSGAGAERGREGGDADRGAFGPGGDAAGTAASRPRRLPLGRRRPNRHSTHG